MIYTRLFRAIVVSLFVPLIPQLVWAGPEDKFYEAFYLETEKGDCAAAVELYERAAGASDRDIAAQAQARLEGCREELASTDLAALMPPGALAYVELNQPGTQVARLLERLGLLAGPGPVPSDAGKRVAISPELIQAALGIRGAAVAITGFNPMLGQPSGVAVLDPGRHEVIRGLIETALPTEARSVEPIAGFATFSVEGQAFITLTSRLVIISNDRKQIEGVVRRLKGTETASLAEDRVMAAELKNRDDSLLVVFVNATAVMPIVKPMLGMGAAMNPELAMVQGLFDPGSLQTLSMRTGVADEGLVLNVGIRLDKDHHNLAYNFLRTPAINADTLELVPEGVAALVVSALNEAGSQYSGGSSGGAGKAPVVTAMDLGREVFANITSYAMFVLPPAESSENGVPIPDAGVILTVNDPAKSEALWTTILGITALATGKTASGATRIEIDGIPVRTYQFPPGIEVCVANTDADFVITTGKRAMKAVIAAGKQGKSVTKDDGLTGAVSRIDADTTQVIVLHAGRAAQVVSRLVPPSELDKIAPILGLLEKTVASIVIDHSNERFRMSMLVSDVPNISSLVSQELVQQEAREEREAQLTKAVQSGSPNEALAAIDAQLQDGPNANLLHAKFKVLAIKKKDRDAALAVGEQLFTLQNNDATVLNNFAWALLTEDQYGGSYNDLALKFSTRSNELTHFGSWTFLDTLAWAKFKTGDPGQAIDLQKKAIEHCRCGGYEGLGKGLVEFEAAIGESKVAAKDKM